MAKPVKTPEGTWRVQFMVNNVRDGGTFATKREAEHYQASRKTSLLTAKEQGLGAVKTLVDALDEYGLKVSPTKRGCSKELIRLAAFKKQKLPLNKPLSQVSTADLVVWRDSRLKVNARGSVLRDITLLGNVFEVARREWQWIRENPMKDVKKPANPDHRKRTITGSEIRSMLRSMGYKPIIRSVSNACAHCFLMALSTGMRAGELTSLKWADVHEHHVVLHTSKTGVGRDVPLSSVAKRLLERMRRWDDVLVFGVTSQSLDALFRKYRDRAGLSGFTFHDSRRNAATRISKKVNPLMLTRIFGWTDPKMAMTYYAPSPEEMSKLLA